MCIRDRKRTQRPIGKGNDEICLIGSHELEDELYKRLRLASGDGIIKSRAAIARELGRSKGSAIGTDRDPMAGASGGSRDWESCSAVPV